MGERTILREQYWARKEAIRKNSATDELAVTIQTLSANLVKQQPGIQVRLRKTSQIIIEQSKNAVLQQLKAKLLHEDYSENVLQQDARNRHYASNLERIVVKEEILTRQYFDETGNVNTIKFCSRNSYSRICSSPFPGLLTNILAYQKCYRRSDRGITTLTRQIRQKMGRRVRTMREGQVRPERYNYA